MFGKDAECSSVEATNLLFSAGAEPRRPGLCAQRSCTPLLCKLKAQAAGLCSVPLAEKLLGKPIV